MLVSHFQSPHIQTSVTRTPELVILHRCCLFTKFAVNPQRREAFMQGKLGPQVELVAALSEDHQTHGYHAWKLR